MALLKMGISIAIGFFILSYIENNEKAVKELPFVGDQLYNKLKDNRDSVIIVMMGIINLIL